MWRYTPVLNVCVQLLLSCLLGAVAASAGVVPPPARRALQTFVFHVALPLHVCRGVALRVDFRDRALYPFVGVFLVIRALALLASAAAVLTPRARFPNPRVHPLADDRPVVLGDPTLASRLCETWLGLSWFSTIVVGLPVLTAALGDQNLAFRLALQAAISSFIFQLPGILLLLETHAATPLVPAPDAPLLAARALARLAKNPVLWGIASGIVLSVTRAGQWLDAPSHPPTSASQNAAFIEATARSFGAVVTPLGMFVTGAWMAHRGTEMRGTPGTPGTTQTEGTSPSGHTPSAPPLEFVSVAPQPGTNPSPAPSPSPSPSPSPTRAPVVSSSRSRLAFSLCVLVAKLVVVPAVTFALSRATGVLSREEVIGATLIASLPVSVASVVLTERHGAPSDIVAAQVVGGVACVLPATLAWCAALRA